jgi:hypothetical protein
MQPAEQALREMLPWHVNGTLDPRQQDGLARELALWPHLRGEIVWLRRLRQQVGEAMGERVAQRADTAGLDTLMSLIHAEQAGKVVALRPRATLRSRALRWMPGAVGLAAAVLLAQSMLLGSLSEQSGSSLTPLAGNTGTAGAAGGALLQVTFKPAVSEAQIRALLVELHAEVVSGPGALGVYTVRVPAGQGRQALQKLQRESARVDSVNLQPER